MKNTESNTTMKAMYMGTIPCTITEPNENGGMIGITIEQDADGLTAGQFLFVFPSDLGISTPSAPSPLDGLKDIAECNDCSFERGCDDDGEYVRMGGSLSDLEAAERSARGSIMNLFVERTGTGFYFRA